MERVIPAVFVYITLSFNERGISYWRALWCGWTSIKQCFSLTSEEQSIIVFKVKPSSSSPVSLRHTWGVEGRNTSRLNDFQRSVCVYTWVRMNVLHMWMDKLPVLPPISAIPPCCPQWEWICCSTLLSSADVPSDWLTLHLALCVTVEMETSVPQSQWRCCAQAPVTWQRILILSSQKWGGEVCAGGK